ncbi:MAG: hypothetical protein IJV13_08070 [Prevotella sp.]|nr:hypothetical protein [Prevotella sp.]
MTRISAALFLGTSFFVLTGCTPSVLTDDIDATFPAKTTEQVNVYENVDSLPAALQWIGKVMVVDNGFATKCQYPQVLKLAKEKTASMGGNGLWITHHALPSFSHGTCHQIAGVMLLTGDSVETNSVSANSIYNRVRMFQTIRQQKQAASVAPLQTLRVSFGPSFITSKIDTPYGDGDKQVGVEIDLDYEKMLSRLIGIGLNMSYMHNNVRNVGNLSQLYVGPSLVIRGRLGKQWIGGISWGFGYSHVSGDEKKSGLGIMWKAGIEYVLAERMGIGLHVVSANGRYKKPAGVTFQDNEYYGITRFCPVLGFNFYI